MRKLIVFSYLFSEHLPILLIIWWKVPGHSLKIGWLIPTIQPQFQLHANMSQWLWGLPDLTHLSLYHTGKIINTLPFCTGFFQFSWKIDFENPNFIILEETLHGRFQKNIFDCLVKWILCQMWDTTTLTHSIRQIQLLFPRSKWNMGEILAFLA